MDLPSIKELIDTETPFLVTPHLHTLQVTPSIRTSLKERVKNANYLASWLLQKMQGIDMKGLSIEEFEQVRECVDYIYFYVKQVTREKGWPFEEKRKLRALTLSIKLGGKVSPDWILDSKSEPFRHFILKNHLQHRLFALRLQLPFDEEKGVFIPIEKDKNLVWIPFAALKEVVEGEKKQFFLGQELLFETDTVGKLSMAYPLLYKGITFQTEGTFFPYDVRDPKEWGEKYSLEVWTVAMRVPKEKPSMIRKTHAYFCLKSKNGELRSCGQDVLVMIKDTSIRELFGRKAGAGRITIPDNYVFYPKTARLYWRAIIDISEEEHNRIIEIVEKDKKSKEHIASLLRGNCVSYVAKILKQGIHLEIDPRMHALHVFGKHFLPNRWYRALFKRFDPWYAKKPKWFQEMLFFFPLCYIPLVVVGLIASCLKTGNVDGKVDFRFIEVLKAPWVLSCAHPLQLQRQLEREAMRSDRIYVNKKSGNGASL